MVLYLDHAGQGEERHSAKRQVMDIVSMTRRLLGESREGTDDVDVEDGLGLVPGDIADSAVIYTDGSSLGNPGPAGAAAVLVRGNSSYRGVGLGGRGVEQRSRVRGH